MTNPNGYTSISQNSELFAALKRQTDQILALNNVMMATANSPQLNQTLAAALEAALAVIPLEASGISLVDYSTGELVLLAQRGWRQDFTTQPMRVKLGEGLSGLTITSGKPVITGDVSGDPRLRVPAFAEEGIQAMALLPMRARGRVIGILSVMSHTPYSFSQSEVNVLQVIADQVGLAIDNVLLVDTARAQQSRLEAVLHATADAIIATDERGVINLVNHAATSLFKVSLHDLLGRPLREATFLPQIKDKLERAMRRDLSAERVFEVVLNDEQIMLCEVAPVPIRSDIDDDSWVIVLRDITHMKQAEKLRLQFIQTAAHELRNPLGVTLGALHILGRNFEDQTTAEDKELFDIAFRGISRMQDLIDDLLNLEHIESGIGFRFEPIDVLAMLRRCAEDMLPVLANKNHQLVTDFPTEIPTFQGDERWLSRAVMNLISNAHKYTQEGGIIRLKAKLQFASERRELVIQVEDNGPGIPREAQRRLFDRFYRVRHMERTHGTGLGLAIVKSVVEQHKGRVSVYSELPLFSPLWQNKGATFSIFLPFRSHPDD